MAKGTTVYIGSKLVQIPPAQILATFFKGYKHPDPKNPWAKSMLCSIYDEGESGITFNQLHKEMQRRGHKWKNVAPPKLNVFARIVAKSLRVKVGKDPFYSLLLVDFDYDAEWSINGKIHLQPEVSKALELSGWVKTRKKTNKERNTDSVDPVDPDSFLVDETNTRDVLVRKKERSRAARNACIKKYKAICAACDLSFGENFGKEFIGLIQVHHLHPLSFNKKKKTDFEKDLRPICPNCHAMAHWNRHNQSPRSIEEVRRIVNR